MAHHAKWRITRTDTVCVYGTRCINEFLPAADSVQSKMPSTSSEDESEPVVPTSADFGNGLSMDTDFAENFSMNSVISDLFDKLPEDASGFDFFTELER